MYKSIIVIACINFCSTPFPPSWETPWGFVISFKANYKFPVSWEPLAISTLVFVKEPQFTSCRVL